jgi:hypothetical protein
LSLPVLLFATLLGFAIWLMVTGIQASPWQPVPLGLALLVVFLFATTTEAFLALALERVALFQLGARRMKLGMGESKSVVYNLAPDFVQSGSDYTMRIIFGFFPLPIWLMLAWYVGLLRPIFALVAAAGILVSVAQVALLSFLWRHRKLKLFAMDDEQGPTRFYRAITGKSHA